jgi:hypothetical protein
MKNIKTINLSNKKIAIDSVVNSYSSRISSHKASHAYYYYSKLKFLGADNIDVLTKKDDIHKYDIWIIVLPKEFAGSFNVFGGATDELAEHLKRFTEFKGKIYIADHEMPDLGEWINSRKSSCTDNFMALDHDLFTKRCLNDVEQVSFDLDSRGFILGDSHSISIYRPGYDMSRNDGKTLSGILKQGLGTLLPTNHHIEHLIVYFMNIDIRHHLLRKGEDLATHYKNLLQNYEDQLKDLGIKNISIVEPLWIEHEDRKLPKTGYFLDTPFYGSMDKRKMLVDITIKQFRGMCDRNGWESIDWPKNMLNDEGLLDFKYMEKPRSIHLSREFYHFDFSTNKKNDKFFNLF